MKIYPMLRCRSILPFVQGWRFKALLGGVVALAGLSIAFGQEPAKETGAKKTPDVMKKDLVIKRVFDAPVGAVWKAWTEPAKVRVWWGPTGFTCPSAKIDLREGGVALVCMRAPKDFGGQDMYSTWSYKKIVPNERIDYIHNLADQNGKKVDPTKLGMPADFPQDQLHTVLFQSLGANKTELTITEHGWAMGQMRELSEMGMNQCLDKMATLFAKPAQPGQ